jgi:hypothetical protein
MTRILLLLMAATILLSCSVKLKFSNTTRPGGYAMGENVTLKFSISPANKAPDRILVNILETKTGSMYTLQVDKGRCGDACEYATKWQGRKPDGSWPVGGKYLVFAMAGDEKC